MDEDARDNWQERCERYFTSLTDSDKQRQRDKKIKNKQTRDEWNSLATVGAVKPQSRSRKSSIQHWFRAMDLHGIHFAGSTQSVLECSVWVLITLVAIGAFSFLLFLTISSYISQQSHFNLKLSSFTNKNHPETQITVCNLNLLKRSSLLNYENRFSMLATTFNSGSFISNENPSTERLLRNSELWSVLKNSLGNGAQTLMSELDEQFLPYSGMNSSTDWDTLFKASMVYGFGIWKEAVTPTIAELKQFGHKPSDILVQCFREDSGSCQLSTDEYIHPSEGRCAAFKVSGNTVKISLLLNSETSETVPVLTPSHGLSVRVNPVHSSSETSRRYEVSPGNHLIIDTKKVSSISRSTKCSNHQLVQDCETSCVDIQTDKFCRCHIDGMESTQCRINNKFEYVCSRVVKKLLLSGSLDCKCQPQCSETNYDTESSTVPWPSSQHLTPLEMFLQQKNFNKTSIKSDLSLVTINLIPRVYEEIAEDQSFTLLELLSRIGGLSALVVGMSFITIFQIIWLFIKLCFHAALSRRSDSDRTVERLANSEITSITWQGYKKNNSNDQRQRFSFQSDFGTCLRRNNSRRSYLEPIEEERKPEHSTKKEDIMIEEDQLFTHPWDRTGHRRPYSTTINRADGGEFPLFNYIDSRSSSPLPRCSTPDNSDYRSTAKLVPADGDVCMYPTRNKIVSPADAIQSYRAQTSNKYQYSGPFYL